MYLISALGLEQDIPDYDMDTADEAWVSSQTRRLEMDPLKFEQMMDRLEKSSGQTVVTLNEAKALLKQDDEISIAVYDYWLNKRLKTQHPLLLSVRTENRTGIAANNPYLAFRRRTEKMQTRKNRKNDEQSYEKMLKLRRDLSRAVTLLELIKRREKTKREQLHLSIEIFEKRYQTKDFTGQLLNEYTSSAVKTTRYVMLFCIHQWQLNTKRFYLLDLHLRRFTLINTHIRRQRRLQRLPINGRPTTINSLRINSIPCRVVASQSVLREPHQVSSGTSTVRATVVVEKRNGSTRNGNIKRNNGTNRIQVLVSRQLSVICSRSFL